jgi:stress-induced morphogen
MVDAQLLKAIHDALKRACFNDPDDSVNVSMGEDDDSVHVVIVSQKFDRKRMREKNDQIWSILEQELRPEQRNKVSLTIGFSPEELKALV